MSTPQRQFNSGWADPVRLNGPSSYNINPENISYPLYSDDPFRHDSQSLEKRLKEDSTRLFTTWDQNINVGVINFRKDDPYNPERKPCDANKAETLESWFAVRNPSNLIMHDAKYQLSGILDSHRTYQQ